MKHVDPRGLSPGYAHQLEGSSPGVQFGSVISRGLFSAHPGSHLILSLSEQKMNEKGKPMRISSHKVSEFKQCKLWV